ncbi:sulfite oxidase heme-binding subunit YedZ [Zooshikella sp. RANM57]|uniref:sulfite oxidase heme-binding subunit YedZ n=1 Tax=Zooshikella sp. RANM57 TaxID=3425863 RepID=UPI003D6FF40D
MGLAIKLDKIAVFSLALFPAGYLVWLIIGQQLGPDPAKEVVLFLATWALNFLWITLALSPIKLILKKSFVIRYRRMLGLFSLFYAVLHVLAYLAFMLAWQWNDLLQDLVKRPYIVVGFIALVGLIALGVTSPKVMVRRLGKSWKKLHNIIYVIAVLVMVHFFWLSRTDVGEPVMYSFILAGLLFVRWFYWGNNWLYQLFFSPSSKAK